MTQVVKVAKTLHSLRAEARKQEAGQFSPWAGPGVFLSDLAPRPRASVAPENLRLVSEDSHRQGRVVWDGSLARQGHSLSRGVSSPMGRIINNLGYGQVPDLKEIED